MDKVIKLVVAILHGVVIQRITLRLRIALAILLTGLVATLHHFAVSRGWVDPSAAETIADVLYGAIGGIFFVSVTGRPNEWNGLAPGIAVVPPKTPLPEKPDSGGMVGIVEPGPAPEKPEPLTRIK